MLLFIAITGFTVSSMAQLRVNINIGTQPVWGPTGYDYVDYYYLPDIGAYYYVPDQVYYFRHGNSWRRYRNLPPQYANYDLYHSHKVVINGVNRPYLQDDRYRQQYGAFRGRNDQTPIRDSREEKYFENRNHPQHAQWQQSHGNNGNNGRNMSRGRDNDRNRH